MKRYLIAFILLPLLPLRLLLFSLGWLRLVLWRWRTLAPNKYYVLDWSGEIVDDEPEGRFERWVRNLVVPRSDGVLLSEVRRLRRSLEIRAPRGLVIRLGELDAGYARCVELRDELRHIAKTTKVYVQLGSGGAGRELVVASAAHHISAPRSSQLSVVGAASTAFFAKRALGLLGLRARVASRGRYKSAIEPFTRTERSAEDREQTLAIVSGFDELVIETLSERSNRARDEVLKVMDLGPCSGTRAAERKLIDAALSEEDLVQKISTDASLPKLRLIRGDGLWRGERVPRLRLLRSAKKEIGLVTVSGPIVDRRAPHRLTQAAEPEVIDDLRTALADDDLAAIVLCINSPGGSVSASDAILEAVRRLDQDKPVVACFSDVAASGGYFIACGTRHIVASPHTITGSIGVLHLLPDASELLERLQLAVDTVKIRRNADFASPWRALTHEEQDLLDLEVGEVYDRFLELVSTARHRSVEEIASIAEGRVWLGSAALEHGLVDELGGLEVAVEAARKLAQVDCEEEPRLVRTKRRAQNRLPLSPHSDPVEALLASLGPSNKGENRLLRELWMLRETSRRGSFLYAPLLIH